MSLVFKLSRGNIGFMTNIGEGKYKKENLINNLDIRILNDNIIDLSESLEKTSKSSEKYSKVMAVLSFVLLFVAVLQLLISTQSLNKSFWVISFLILFQLGSVYLLLREAFGWIEGQHKN